MKRPRLWSGVLALVAAGAALAGEAAHPDLTGVWKIVDYTPSLVSSDGRPPPLRPEAKRLLEEHQAMAARGDRSFDGTVQCLPEGLPRLMRVNKPFEILQRDKAVYIVAQNRLTRRAYFGESLPVDADPLYLGYSVARWEGRTLVIDSAGFREGTLLDDAGTPHSAALKVTERYTLSRNGKAIDARFIVDDAGTFTRPWTASARYRKLDGYQLPEEVCADKARPPAPRG